MPGAGQGFPEMGRRGPAAKPTSLRLLHGDKPSRINRQEPKPRDVPLRRPDWLNPGPSSEMWDALTPHLEEMGTAKITDEFGLALLCETFARWRRISQLASHSAPVFDRRDRDAEGKPIGDQPVFVKNPLYAQERDAGDQLRVLLREFGLTPSARAGLRVTVELPGQVERLFTGNV